MVAFAWLRRVQRTKNQRYRDGGIYLVYYVSTDVLCRIGIIWSAPYLSSNSLIWTCGGYGLVDPSSELTAFSGIRSSGDQDFLVLFFVPLLNASNSFNALPYKWVCTFLKIRSGRSFAVHIVHNGIYPGNLSYVFVHSQILMPMNLQCHSNHNND